MVQRRGDEIFTSQYVQTCDIPVETFQIEPFTLVIFGGTGDLSKKKLLPTLFHIFRENEIPREFSILGIGSSPMDDEQYRSQVQEALQNFPEEPFDPARWEEFCQHIFYLSGHLEAEEIYQNLSTKIDGIHPSPLPGHKDVIYYMALPPQITPLVVERLNHHGLSRGIFNTKIIVEKPFGRGRDSARQLNGLLTRVFDEPQIYRIDHYLGKETVQNIIFFRFSNSIFEQLWNRRYIDHVQITVAEEIGIENRARFYEQSGVVRDIVQNHVLQIIGLIAMEPPVGFDADFIRDEKAKVFRSIQPVREEHIDRFMVRGQYGPGKINGRDVPGYRQEKGVDPNSNAQTLFAGAFYVANWRWAGVPFYVRTGKRLAKRVTEIAIQFEQPPLRLFGRSCDALDPNVLILSIQPDEKITLCFGVKVPNMPNQIYPVQMNFGYRDTFQTKYHPAYERLLLDCLKGDLTLFVREDGIEAMWAVVDPILTYWENTPPKNFPNYSAGSWGPAEVQRLLEEEGRRWMTE